jgi:3-isopropylmalate dehydratase small subunit
MSAPQALAPLYLHPDAMRKFDVLTGVAAPLLRANVDTDAIIPSREMKSVSKRGLADGLFAGWRYLAIGERDPNPEFVLNQPAYAGTRILLAGENFGCGSSREHAVWALDEYGIRAVIAPGFAPIFRGNCVRNGLLPVRLDASAVARLAAAVAPDPQRRLVTVDLVSQRVSGPDGIDLSFDLDPESREMLLEGLDAIDLTLKHHDAIEAFLARDRVERPWIYLQSRFRRSDGMTIDVLVSEVGPRDGLQSIHPVMPLEAKKAWIAAEAAAGVREIEVGSFVPAKLLPQLADTAEVVAFARAIPGLTVAALVPNLKGAEAAVAAGAHKITLPLSASETHSLKNLRRTHAQVLDEVRGIVALLGSLPADRRPRFEGGLSTAFGCTLEGEVPADRVVRLAEQLMAAGCDEVGLSDTTGYANPAQVKDLVRRARARGPAPAQHPRPRARQRDGRSRGGHHHLRQLTRRTRRLPVRARGVGQHRHRGPRVHARGHGPAHRHRLAEAARGATRPARGAAGRSALRLHAGCRAAARVPARDARRGGAMTGSEATPAPAPLAGLRVVEFTHMVMGPAVGAILVELGAEVIKVEPVGGDATRQLLGSGAGYFAMYNRNKKSLCLDLKHPKGLAIARELAASADVVVENFRSGTMDKLGLGYEALAALNPRLIYCSEKGFLSGPYEHRTALDEVAR